MPITENDGGVLYELDTITSNGGGTLYELDTVHENDGGVLYEIFSARLIKALEWQYAGGSGSMTTSDNGLSVSVYSKNASDPYYKIKCNQFAVSKQNWNITVQYEFEQQSPYNYCLVQVYDSSNKLVFGEYRYSTDGINGSYSIPINSAGTYYIIFQGHGSNSRVNFSCLIK